MNFVNNQRCLYTIRVLIYNNNSVKVGATLTDTVSKSDSAGQHKPWLQLAQVFHKSKSHRLSKQFISRRCHCIRSVGYKWEVNRRQRRRGKSNMSDECDVGHNCSATRLMQQCYKGLSASTTTITAHASQSGLRHTWPLRTSQIQQIRKLCNYKQVQLIPRVQSFTN